MTTQGTGVMTPTDKQRRDDNFVRSTVGQTTAVSRDEEGEKNSGLELNDDQ